MPAFEQLFLAAEAGADGVRPGRPRPGPADLPGAQADRARDRGARAATVYFASLSSRTIVYKGMLTTEQLPAFFPDLTDDRIESAIAIVHSRFSTNTFPAWPLAHPFRYIAHNGEINTVRGNRNRMRAREALLASELIPGDLSRRSRSAPPAPRTRPRSTRCSSCCTWAAARCRTRCMMMIPEAWENNATLDPTIRGFAEFHASLMEPWDGPACVTFTDGPLLGAVLDRNGLRPGPLVADRPTTPWCWRPSPACCRSRRRRSSSAAGCSPAGCSWSTPSRAGSSTTPRSRSRWPPSSPTATGCTPALIALADLPAREQTHPAPRGVLHRQKIFGYTEEELRVLITPMAATGAEGIGSMGTDTPEAVLSTRPRLIFDYFSQLFAQVTNPPLDAIREQVVTSLASVLGPEGNLLEPDPGVLPQVVLPFPVIDNDDLARLIGVNSDGDLPGLASAVVSGLYEVAGGGAALAAAIEHARREADDAIAAGARIIMLSDRDSDADAGADPVAAADLRRAPAPGPAEDPDQGRSGRRVRRRPRGAPRRAAARLRRGAVNPYLVLETAADLARQGLRRGHAGEGGQEHRVRAGQGRAQGDEQDGHLHRRAPTPAPRCSPCSASTRRCWTSTSPAPSPAPAAADWTSSPPTSRPGTRWPSRPTTRALEHRRLEIGGQYQWRREGEIHLFNPETVYLLQHSTRSKQEKVFRRYTDAVDELSREGGTLRGLFELRDRRPAGRPAGRGRAGVGDRQAVRHRRDVLRLDLRRGARDAGHRDEPARRQVEHRRGRRGRRPAARPGRGGRRSSRSRPAGSA